MIQHFVLLGYRIVKNDDAFCIAVYKEGMAVGDSSYLFVSLCGVVTNSRWGSVCTSRHGSALWDLSAPLCSSYITHTHSEY